MVRYYGHYSNVKRGKRKKEEQDNVTPNIIEESTISPALRKAWARLIQKIYEVAPLTYPKCLVSMRIIALIEREEIIRKILKHLGLWHVQKRPPPRIHSPPAELYADYSDSQIPPWDDYLTSVTYTIYCVTPLPTENQYYYHQGHQSGSRNYQHFVEKFKLKIVRWRVKMIAR